MAKDCLLDPITNPTYQNPEVWGSLCFTRSCLDLSKWGVKSGRQLRYSKREFVTAKFCDIRPQELRWAGSALRSGTDRSFPAELWVKTICHRWGTLPTIWRASLGLLSTTTPWLCYKHLRLLEGIRLSFFVTSLTLSQFLFSHVVLPHVLEKHL